MKLGNKRAEAAIESLDIPEDQKDLLRATLANALDLDLATMPEQGQYWRRRADGEIYVVARVGYGKDELLLISLDNGTRWDNLGFPIFGNEGEESFEYVGRGIQALRQLNSKGELK